MKTAVDTVLVGNNRTYSRHFQQMCEHYLVDPFACAPASDREEEQVEGDATVAEVCRKAGIGVATFYN